jgi:hypothetical protein
MSGFLVRRSTKCGSRTSVAQPGDGCSEMRLQRVPEFDNQRMLLQRVLDDATLNALAAAVDQADLTEAGFVRGGDVFRDDGRDVTWRELVQIEVVLDGNTVRHRATATPVTDTTP